MSILILSIISFIFALMPFFKTMLVTIFISTCTIVLAIIYQKKQKSEPNSKKKNEILIISVIISILAMVFSIVNYTILPPKDKDVGSAIENRIESYTQYNKEDEININNKFKMQVNSINYDGSKCFIDVKITGISDESTMLLNNFFIYHSESEQVIFASSTTNKDISYYNEIYKDEIVEDVIIFEVENIKNVEELYLIYRDDVNGVKIKL